jgi:hypothetical protein
MLAVYLQFVVAAPGERRHHRFDAGAAALLRIVDAE